jgi:hypothetical protein
MLLVLVPSHITTLRFFFFSVFLTLNHRCMSIVINNIFFSLTILLFFFYSFFYTVNR